MSGATTITIEVNGEPRTTPAGATVRQLLEELALPPERIARIAIELNRALLPKDRFGQPLAAGDRLEIVTFVGGG